MAKTASATKTNKPKTQIQQGMGASVNKKEIDRIFELQKRKSIALRSSTAADRIEKLKKLRDVIFKRQAEIAAALGKDFRKSPVEVDITEILPTISEINDNIRHLSSWMKPTRVPTPITMFGSTSYVKYEPRGVCLIISPWNYPFILAFSPIAAAIAAGNTCLLKPSEYTPHTSQITQELLAEVFPEDEVSVFQGDYQVSNYLADLPVDHIFFTGSPAVGKLIMSQAAKNLTSVTLELGGKCPVLIDEKSNIQLAAERVMWGKFVNAGQTCIAPDYVFLPESKLQPFLEASQSVMEKFFGSSQDQFDKSPDFCRIINRRNFDRVSGYVDDAVKRGAKVAFGGKRDEKTNYLSPTILTGIAPGSKILEEEIFGPILPVLTYKSIDEALHFVNSKPKPLALYIFSKANSFIKKVLGQTSSGGTAINDVMTHFVNENLPFGGVNHSGHGSYHGYYGFKAFSHERAVISQPSFSMVKLMYPPYKPLVKKLVDLTTRFFV